MLLFVFKRFSGGWWRSLGVDMSPRRGRVGKGPNWKTPLQSFGCPSLNHLCFRDQLGGKATNWMSFEAHGETAIALFLRHPTPGRVKTRLAAAIGSDSATKFYKLCAETIVDTCSR